MFDDIDDMTDGDVDVSDEEDVGHFMWCQG